MNDPFVAHRSLLFTVAYEMLGSAADAEDVVQESWLRWAQVDHASVRDPRGYLVRIVTRQALNRMRTIARQREEYVGEWLPEPLLTSPDVAEDVALADSISLALLTVLETLEPTERAVFVLREVFDVPYAEISEAVGRSPAAVRQTAHRARGRVAERRPRVAVSAAEQRAVVERFLAAVETGDLQSVLDVLAPDVVLVADGGGVAQAVKQPVLGAKRVANLMVGGLAYAARDSEIAFDLVWVNGAPAIRAKLDGALDTIVWFEIAEGRIDRIAAQRNPAKLGRLGEAALLGR
jgi:RNA polymerase sigma-70 factor (ECF subfamily)